MQKGEVLLPMKKRGFGKDRFNGVGGKVEAGETIEEAARREVFEEIAVEVGPLKKMATIEFFYRETSKEIWCQEVHVFTATEWKGTPQESDEMAPHWFPIQSLPFEKMWSDDPYWLPKVLSGESLKARFHYTPEITIESYEVTPL